jgi:hypothetical protein
LNALRRLRALLADLPLSDLQLNPVSGVVNQIESEMLEGAAAVLALGSLQQMIDVRFFGHSRPCPICAQHKTHATTCYVRKATGWDLLDETEATIRENDELRRALARHLPHNGKTILAGQPYRSLKDRARLHGG